MSRRIIGYFSQNIIDLLQLDIYAGTPIFISDSNIEHMKSSHPVDFEKYGCDIKDIIARPDYVGKNIKDGSIEFTREYYISGDYVKVAVRVTSNNVYYARSMYVLNPKRAINFIAKGTLKKLSSIFENVPKNL